MKEERPIRFNLLTKEELIYEVVIRDAVPERTIELLRAQIRHLAQDIPSDEVSEFEGDALAELKTISSKIDELEELCNRKPLLLKKLNRVQTLGNHVFHRLSRVEATEESDRTLWERLDERLIPLLKRIDRMTHTFVSSYDFQPAEEEVSGVPGLAENEPLMVKPVNCFACVHSLNLRFNGKDSVQDFIVRIEELCLSRNISREKLFNSAVELFTDEALYWYRGTRDQLNSWEYLKASLLEEYLPYDYDHRLLQEIRSRTQGPDESISSYLSIMQNYFSKLRKPLDEEEKLSLIKLSTHRLDSPSCCPHHYVRRKPGTALQRSARAAGGAALGSRHLDFLPPSANARRAPLHFLISCNNMKNYQ
ncbi:uncharacterized protein LOC114366570 [Ostrinia furnacalis]|uniref:uncharacterized protein LOC114366570 n=1 Tax=Ostrinia furnacalis TaxID=93504 RepID=UPI00103B08BB|nr:uncharacterized protein LOC114366570 [Ostrinia furnacalis]XP_028179290.1 uncharacterized protein LOC114366570 [Ostrinia furnacalis]